MSETIATRAGKAIKATFAQIAGAAQVARTSTELTAVLDSLNAEIEAERLKLASLEDSRETLVLVGADIDSFAIKVVHAEQRLKTLRANAAEIQRRRDEEATKEARANLEAHAKAVTDAEVPALEEAHRTFLSSLKAVADAAEAMEVHSTRLDDLNYSLKHNDRPDLVVSQEQIRLRVAEEFYAAPYDLTEIEAPPPPVIQDLQKFPNEAPEYYRQRNEKYKAEVMASYESQIALRHQNRAAIDHSLRRTESPFAQLGARVVDVIEAVCFPGDAWYKARNRRRVDVLSHPNGPKVIQATDGRADGKGGPGLYRGPHRPESDFRSE